MVISAGKISIDLFIWKFICAQKEQVVEILKSFA